jgi:hypothetical protein
LFNLFIFLHVLGTIMVDPFSFLLRWHGGASGHLW